MPPKPNCGRKAVDIFWSHQKHINNPRNKPILILAYNVEDVLNLLSIFLLVLKTDWSTKPKPYWPNAREVKRQVARNRYKFAIKFADIWEGGRKVLNI